VVSTALALWFVGVASSARGATSPGSANGARLEPAALEVPRNGVPTVGFTMAQVGPGAAVLTTGLSVPEAADARRLLVRAAGPALASFGMEAPLARPTITIFKATGENVAANDGWMADAENVRAASSAAGTFPFAAGSTDAALVLALPAGNYTVQVGSAAGDTGTVLLEIYDVSGAAQQPGIASATNSARSVTTLRLSPIRRDVAAAQLLLHLPLTGDLADAAGHGRSIRAQAVQFRGGAAWFDGKQSEIVLPGVAFDRRAFSVAMWIKLEDDYSSIGLVQQRAANRRNQHLHLVLRFNAPRLGFYLNDLQTVRSVRTGNGWTHVVFQYNGREQEVWVDGERTGVRPARPYVGAAGELQVGRAPVWSNVPAHDFKGGMRDLRVYSRALAPVEIRALAKL
jgi:hypothetical protein